MSKSLNNYIGIDELPSEMYGKVMSIPDHLIMPYLELATDVPDEELNEFRQQLDGQSVNPMLLKKRLAREIVTQFHNAKAAQEAEEHFTRVVQRKELWGTVKITGTLTTVVWKDITNLLVEAKLAKSRAEAKRLLTQGAIEVDGKKLTDTHVELKGRIVIKVGKRHFLKIDADKQTWQTFKS
jgi:tyrosyl-tRNA synthetase